MRHTALNLLKQETTAKVGLNAERDNDYLLTLLAG
jgi:hypothetical protein